MSPGLYILTISLLPMTAIIVFAMKYASSLAAARARSAEDNELKAIIERTLEELASLRAAVELVAKEQAKQGDGITRIDGILREVG